MAFESTFTSWNNFIISAKQTLIEICIFQCWHFKLTFLSSHKFHMLDCKWEKQPLQIALFLAAFAFLEFVLTCVGLLFRKHIKCVIQMNWLRIMCCCAVVLKGLGIWPEETRGWSDLEKIPSDSTSVPASSLTSPLITTLSLSKCADMHASKQAHACTHIWWAVLYADWLCRAASFTVYGGDIDTW